MKNSPAFQWYPADYLASMRVQIMSLEQEGIYRRLLDYCWLNGSIPSDVSMLKRLIGKECSNGAIEMVVSMFQPGKPGELVHDRLDAERRKQAEWRRKSSEGGRISAEKRSSQRAENQRPAQGSFQNGTNQKATLQSSVFSLQSSDPIPARVPKETKPRQPNLKLEALVRCQCGTITGVPKTVWGFAQRTLRELEEAHPEVTPDEIRRRWANLKLRFSEECSFAALLKWWPQCDAPPATNGSGHFEKPRMAENLRGIPA